jgi:DNA (cytosine-5)-methyltransferase 1
MGKANILVKLLDENELLNVLKISKDNLRELHEMSKIPYYKISGQNRYDPSEVARALKPISNSDISIEQSSSKTYRGIDLFAGIGGIRLGFEQAFHEQIKFVYSNDHNKFACETYRANFGEIDDSDIVEKTKNISQIPDHDILVGGFPCQPFSIAGEQLGFEDKTRGTLFYAIAKIISAKRPAAFLLENVKNFRDHNQGQTWATVKEVLQNELGYKTYDTVLNAKYFGVAQNRPRFYAVGFKDKDTIFEWPKEDEKQVKLKDFLEPHVEESYYIGQQYFNSLKNHRKRHEALGHGFGYRILNPDGIAGTIVVGGMGLERNLIKNTPLQDCWKPGDDPLKKKNCEGVRVLTPRECARLQGFPDSFKIPVSDTQAYKQFANSVAVPVIRAIAKQILLSLEDKVPQRQMFHYPV